MTAQLFKQVGLNFSSAIAVEEFFGKEKRSALTDFERLEQPVPGDPYSGCKTNLYFGFFFDGTKNNYILADKDKSHSNVARLYDCYPGRSVPGVLPAETDWKYNSSRYTHFFRTYIPGVASPFEQVNDTGKGADLQYGAAAGYLGAARISWALLQAVNHVHRFFFESPLLPPEEVASIARNINLNMEFRRAMFFAENMDALEQSGRIQEQTRVTLQEILMRLHGAVSQHWPDKKTGRPQKINPGIVQKIHISIFGFSRGATQARAFTNWLMALCKLDAHLCKRSSGMTLGGFPVVFDFLGIFDTVASVGLGNTLGNSTVGKVFDGHGSWADAEESLRVPDGITCLHLVAAHEIRRSFPVDSVSIHGVTPPNCTETVFPGAHSDIGCGYAPGEQGRGVDPDGNDMLTRIPLLVMYQAARLAGVPLKLELASSLVQKRFELTPDTINAFNAYIAACNTTSGDLSAVMREQGNYYMQWRLLRRSQGKSPLEATACFQRARPFHQNDLHSANLEFEDEIKKFSHWLQSKGEHFTPAKQKDGFANEHYLEWEEIARWWKGPVHLAPAIVRFFDNYVHDSRAGFKPLPGNPEDEAAAVKQLEEWDAKRVKFIKEDAEFSRRFIRDNPGAIPPKFVPGGPVPDGLTNAQRAASEEFARTKKIPRMVTGGREPFESTPSTLYLSPRAGYLRYRKIYGGWDSVLISDENGVGKKTPRAA